MFHWKNFATQVIGRTIDATNWRAPSPLRYRLLAVVGAMILCLFFLPSHFCNPPDFSLDGHWQLMLNKAFSEKWSFGEQIIWTYGPLGFFETRLPCGIGRVWYVLFDLGVVALFLCWAWDTLRSPEIRPLGWAWVVALCCCKKIITDLPSVALYCLLAYLFARNLGRPRVLTSVALAAVSAFLFFYKLNFGLIGIFLSLMITVFKALFKREGLGMWLLAAAVQVLLIGVLAAVFHSQLGPYLKGGLSMIRHYGDGMPVGPGRGSIAHVFIMGCAVLYGVLSLAAVRKCPGAATWLLFLVGGVLTFILAKTAVIRSDPLHHPGFIYGFPIIAIAFLSQVPDAMKPVWRTLCVVTSGYAAVLLVAAYGSSIDYLPKAYIKAFLPWDYAREARNYRRQQPWAVFENSVETDWPERRVPPAVCGRIGTNSVDVFPIEIGMVIGSGLKYQPRPIPQTYTAFGPDLEAANVSFYESAEAPRFVLYSLGHPARSIDTRYFMWEEPILKRLLRRQYRPVLVFTNEQGPFSETNRESPTILLERVTNAPPVQIDPGLTEFQRTRTMFAVPKADEEVYARIKLQKSLFGSLAGALYRGGEITLRMELEDGTVKEYRVVAGNLETGVLVNFFAQPESVESMLNYLSRDSSGNPRCVRIGLFPEHSWEYKKNFEVSYFRCRAK
jgi:hypothetical protein